MLASPRFSQTLVRALAKFNADGSSPSTAEEGAGRSGEIPGFFSFDGKKEKHSGFQQSNSNETPGSLASFLKVSNFLLAVMGQY